MYITKTAKNKEKSNHSICTLAARLNILKELLPCVRKLPFISLSTCMWMDSGVHVLKQRTERATFAEEGHAALAAQHSGLAADSPAIPKTFV